MNVYKDISGDYDLTDLNTVVKPVLSLYDEGTKIQTLGTRKAFVLNPATSEEMIIQFRIVDRDLTPLIDLNDSQTLKLIELFRENIAVVTPANPSVPVTASEVTTPLTLETILTHYPQVFDVSIGGFEGELHLHTSNNITSHKVDPREIS